MYYTGSRLRSSIAALGLAASLLAGCGHGSSGSSILPGTGGGSGSSAQSVGSAPATFTFTFPKPTSSTARARLGSRAPKYLSSATQSISVQVTDTKNAGTNQDIYSSVPSALKAIQYQNFSNLTGNGALAGQCGTDPNNANNYMCTAQFQMPIGIDATTITSYDAAQSGGTSGTCSSACSGHTLSQQKATITIAQGVTNSPHISLDANAAAMTVTTSSGFCAGSFTVSNSGNVATVGTTALTFNVTYTDPAGKTIVSPGLPVLTVNGHTDDNAGNGYTDSTTHLNVKVYQNPPHFVLQQTAGTGNAAVTVNATPAGTSAGYTPPATDGLSFNQSLNFSFQSGSAPPASLLAVAERLANGNNATTGGQIQLYTMTLGTNDTFSANSPSVLPAATDGSSNNTKDVDFPNDLAWDGNGDLLIANGGSGTYQDTTGNFSCVPAGSISTGANNATILANGMNNPHYIAFLTDGSVALSNATAAAPKTSDFVLSGTYTYSPARSIGNTGSYTNIGTNQVIPIPTSGANPAGTYAVAITDGTTQNGNHIVFERPGSSPVELPSDPSDVDSNIGYDAANNQLVVVNSNSTSSDITFWDLGTMTKQKTVVIDDDGSGNAQAAPAAVGTVVAVSPAGYVAVAVLVTNNMEINIYNNTKTSRALVSAPIPFDATQTNGGGFGTDFCYGGSGSTSRVLSMRWITNTKLLVGLESTIGSPPSVTTTAANGLYVFDVSQAASNSEVSPNGCTGTMYTYPINSGSNPTGAVQPYAKQTGFLPLNGPRPLAAAYKP